jgi:sodium-dependent dicarboxylate transporter 2/3/5
VLPRLDISRNAVQWVGLPAGPVLGGLAWVLLPDSYLDPAGREVAFDSAGHASAALAVWMAVWWMTEALPVYATALLPLVVLPMSGALPIGQAAAPYAHELIFLFMGGFIVALSMERWGLHRRIALAALRGGAASPRVAVGRFMLVTAAMSMWVSNTATTLMMLPIALSVIELLTRPGVEGAPCESERLASCLLLGIAYAASIGGIGTLIGTPPNLFLASFVASELGIEISFLRWMLIGVPLVAVFLPIARLLLTRVLFPIGRERIAGIEEHIAFERAALGPMSRGERTTLAVFAAMAAAWIGRPVLVDLGATGLSDAGIAIAAALALFAIPVDVRRREFAMDWETAVRLPWGVLILFGGGLSLAAAIRSNGVGEFLGAQVGALGSVPAPVVVVAAVALVIFLTELTSNTATTATLLPILAGLAPALGMPPLLLLVPVAIAASCAFMLPVATPPNAVVFGSGLVPMPIMVRAGLWLNLVGVALIPSLAYLIARPVLGMEG